MARSSRGGRQKIKLKTIENERERAVTLSKRHDGLFKKAAEIATLCGAQMAIILFTISGKPLSFGSPSVINVMKRFLDSNHVDQQSDAIKVSINGFLKMKLEELNHEFDEFNEKSATCKKHGQSLEEDLKVFLGGETYEDFKNNIGIDKLMHIKYKLKELKRHLQHGSDAGSEPLYIKDEHEMDLSKIQGPKDYLKL